MPDSMRRDGGEGNPSVFMVHMMTCGRVVSRSPMQRLLIPQAFLTEATAGKPDKRRKPNDADNKERREAPRGAEHEQPRGVGGKG